jgi:hypothetical protein
MEIIFILSFLLWFGLAFFFATVAKQAGLTFWLFLVLGLFGSPLTTIFVLAMFNAMKVAREND